VGGPTLIAPQLRAADPKAKKDDSDTWFKNYRRSVAMENGALVIEDQIDVRTSYFQKVSVDAKYWLDKSDDAALAHVQLEESD
jgi:hypothetical protein